MRPRGQHLKLVSPRRARGGRLGSPSQEIPSRGRRKLASTRADLAAEAVRPRPGGGAAMLT